MKRLLIVLLLLLLPARLLAPDDLAQSLEQWARENLDDSVLEALGQIDQDRVRKFLTEVQQRFEGNSIYDLGSLKETALQLLPVLEQFEETLRLEPDNQAAQEFIGQVQKRKNNPP